MSESNRNQYIDIIKGVAILLVILGHSIQYFSGMDEQIVFGMTIERVIYSFHMSLFMLISGYLFYFSLRRHNERDILKSRCKNFVFPIFTVSILHYLYWDASHIHNVKALVVGIPFTAINTLWFFWAILTITALVCIVHRLLKSHWLAYIAVVVTTLLLPDMYPLRMYIHLLPAFLVAFLYAKIYTGRNLKISVIGGGEIALVLSTLCYCILLPTFKYDTMIYFSRYSLLGSNDIISDFGVDFSRFLIGLVGSVVVLLSIHIMIHLCILGQTVSVALAKIGRMTFGIYVFQDLLILATNPIAKQMDAQYCWANTTIAFVLVLLLSVGLTALAEKNRWTSILFLGKFPNRQM